MAPRATSLEIAGTIHAGLAESLGSSTPAIPHQRKRRPEHRMRVPVQSLAVRVPGVGGIDQLEHGQLQRLGARQIRTSMVAHAPRQGARIGDRPVKQPTR